MHPVLNNRTWLAVWLAAWVGAGGILALIAREAAPSFALAGTLALLCITPYWLCKALPLNSTSTLKLGLAHVADGLLISFAAVHIAGFAATGDNWTEVRFAMTGVAFLLDMLAVSAYYAGLGMEASQRAELAIRESQLKALKSQVNPHFLFNSLNSIAALAGSDAERARDMCVRLADFLRTSLKLGERAIIPLSEELALTRMYLDVEQVRFGGKLRFVQDVAAEFGGFSVPSLAIQPLVENAVKHGVAMMAEGGEIRLTGSSAGGRLRLVVENPFDPEAPRQQRTGIGLRNLRERLEAVYGGGAEMLVQPQEREYRVTLNLPARKVEEKR
jgi:hypothetical protein